MATDSAVTGATDVRREQMLRAAASIIGERGFSETRIADVARRSEASPALVIYYFGTKDRLLTEALRYSEDRFYASTAELLERQPTARARFETLVRLTCVPENADETPGAWGLWFDLWAQAFRHAEIARDRIELDQQWRDTIADVVRSGQESGEIGPADVDEFAATFSALLDGLSIQVALRDPVVDPDRAFGIAMSFTSDALGVDWRPKRKSRRGSRASSGRSGTAGGR